MTDFTEDIKDSRTAVLPAQSVVDMSVVRAGTSRIIVVDGRTVPTDRSGDQVASDVLGGTKPCDGLGGDHYQFNKVAIYEPLDDGGLEFQFYNLDPDQHVIVTGAECGHAAAAIAADACLRMPDRFNPDMVEMRNLGTGQQMKCMFHATERFWENTCTLQFRNDGTLRLPEGERPNVVMESGQTVAYEVVVGGNIFVAVEDQHACDDAGVRRDLEKAAVEVASRVRSTRIDESFIRVMPFSINWDDTFHATLHASCFNGSQMHRSLPVSGSIALAELLASRRICVIDPSELEGHEKVVFHLDVQSKASFEPATVEFIRKGEDWGIAHATIDASIRVLFHGQGMLPD